MLAVMLSTCGPVRSVDNEKIMYWASSADRTYHMVGVPATGELTMTIHHGHTNGPWEEAKPGTRHLTFRIRRPSSAGASVEKLMRNDVSCTKVVAYFVEHDADLAGLVERGGVICMPDEVDCDVVRIGHEFMNVKTGETTFVPTDTRRPGGQNLN